MPTYRHGSGFMHLKMTNTAKRPAPAPCCARIPRGSPAIGATMRCCAISSVLCDHVLLDGSTCDAPLCVDHAHEIEHDKHLCPTHLAERRDNEPELF